MLHAVVDMVDVFLVLDPHLAPVYVRVALPPVVVYEGSRPNVFADDRAYGDCCPIFNAV